MKKVFVHVAVLAGVVSLATTAYSVPTLWMSDGGVPVILADGDPGDLSPYAGEVIYQGAVGGWWLTINWGVTKPKIGSATSPRMEIHSIDAISPPSALPSTLTIMFSETDFGPLGPSGALVGVGGTLASGASLTYETWEDPNNQLFGLTHKITSQGFSYVAPGDFSGDTTGSANCGQAFSLTLVIELTHTQYGQTSADGTLAIPDAGSTLSLLGLAMAGLGVLARSRKK